MIYFMVWETWVGIAVLLAGSLIGNELGSFIAGSSLYWFGLTTERIRIIDNIKKYNRLLDE